MVVLYQLWQLIFWDYQVVNIEKKKMYLDN